MYSKSCPGQNLSELAQGVSEGKGMKCWRIQGVWEKMVGKEGGNVINQSLCRATKIITQRSRNWYAFGKCPLTIHALFNDGPCIFISHFALVAPTVRMVNLL